MNVQWTAVVDTATFEPVYELKINGRYVGVKLSPQNMMDAVKLRLTTHYLEEVLWILPTLKSAGLTLEEISAAHFEYIMLVMKFKEQYE